MNAKKALPLVIALVLGVISARMVVKIIQSKPSGAQAQLGPKLTKVVVAARDIAAGEDLESADLQTGEITADSSPGTTYSSSDELVGRVAAAPLVQGQAIVESLLAPKGSGSGLQAVIPTGMRAVTIEINETSGLAGYITPGCHVDIDLTLKDDSSGQMIDRCLVQDVPITAVGMRPVIGQDAGAAAHSATLLVTPRQAELIDLGTAYGKPRLVLRNIRDRSSDELPTVTLAELIGSHPTLPPRPVEMMGPTQPVDVFAATTQPTQQAATDGWRVRVITAGEQNLVNLSVPKPVGPPSVTGTDAKDATAP